MKHQVTTSWRVSLPVIIGFLALLITGCGGSLEELAQRSLYATEYANKVEVPATPPQGFSKVEWRFSEDLSTFGWFYRQPKTNAPVLLYLHGNAVNLGGLDQSGFLNLLVALGTHVVVIDYPGYGLSAGTPNQQSIMTGAQAAIDWMRAEFSSSEIVVWGRSLGAAVAAQLVASNQNSVDRFVLTSGWNHLEALIKHHYGSMADQLPKEWLDQNRWESDQAALQTRLPGLIQHGTKDTTVPFSLGESLAQAFKPSSTQFVVLDGIGHNDIFEVEQLWQQIRRFASGKSISEHVVDASSSL